MTERAIPGGASALPSVRDVSWLELMREQRQERMTRVHLDVVLLQRVADRQWRAVDGTLPSDDVSALLGFVERTSEGYEVTRLLEPNRRIPCPTKDAARRALIGLSGDGGRG